MIDPTIALQGAKPADPLDRYSKLLAIQSGQQQLQAGNLQVQQQQRALSAQQTLDRVMAGAIQPGPDGTPQFNRDAVTQGLANSAGHLIPQVVKSMNDLDTAAADLKTKQLALKTATNDYTAQGLLAIKDAGYDPQVALGTIAHAQSTGALPPAQAVQMTAAIQQNPTAAGVQSIIDPLLSQSPGVQKLLTERQTSGAAVTRANAAQTDANLNADAAPNKQALTAAELEAKQTQNAAAQLATAAQSGDPNAVARVMGMISNPTIRAKFQGLSTADQFKRVGMTPAEQQQADQAAAALKNTQQHQGQEIGVRQQQLAVDRGRLNVEQQRYGFESGGGVSPQARAIAAGNLDPQTTRTLLRSNPGLIAQVQSVDPKFDEANIENRYNTLKEFTNTSVGKAGGQALALNTLIHHADLYQQTAEALKNGTFRPGNAVYNAVANAFGSAPPTQANLVARFFASETGKVASGGVPAEGEINGVLKNLGNDASPDQIKAAGQTLLQIAAGRAIPLQERVAAAKLGNVVQVVGPDAKAILQRRGFDPNSLQPVAAAQPQFGDLKSYGGANYKFDGTVWKKQ